MPSPLILDLSRLVYTAWQRTPTGIPRVELAYARHFIATYPDRLHFVVLDALGRLRAVDNNTAVSFVSAIDHHWHKDTLSKAARFRMALRAARIHVELLLRPGIGIDRLLAHLPGPAIYFVLSHLHMERPAFVQRVKQRHKLRIVYFVHDIIPIEFPEYCPPRELKRDRARMENAARLADAVIVNSRATATAYRRAFDPSRPDNLLAIAPLGVDVSRLETGPAAPPSGTPYFVSVGTIEPRKNHLLLLTLWRSLREELGTACPRLILVGKRGWENENVVDLLERSPLLQDVVEERPGISDAAITRLLREARALLIPSFAEGYGLPLAEALAMGVPAISSDLPSLREIGGNVPEYVSPLDGREWRSLILDYAQRDSEKRSAQLARLARWHEPTWDRHFTRIGELLDQVENPA